MARAMTLASVAATFLLAATLTACGGDGTPSANPYQPDPAIGSTSFYSAAIDPARAGGYDDLVPTDASGGQNGPPDARTVEEGDIYRALGGGLVLNLNTWRGLQVLDLADPDAPALVGALRLAGSPVELYVVGDRAVVLLNDWVGYFAGDDGVCTEGQSGGTVLLVDLADPAAPAVLDYAPVEGNIRTSRLTTGGGQTAVYVASARFFGYEGGGVVPVDAPGGDAAVALDIGDEETVVTSLEVVGDTLAPRTTLDLGGWVTDIQGTPAALLVAVNAWQTNTSRVTVVDISDPGGAMVAGTPIETAGRVESQFNLDLEGTVLRVFSGATWAEPRVNHLETWNVADLQDPEPLDHETFGEGEQLYATLFLADRAFAVTYFVQDPFHAFSLTPEGDATEETAFVVSGWNDFFRPALGDTRLLGVGVDDAAGSRTVAVSLYDVTDLSSATPLLARADVGLPSSWSEASWDHRAFTVLEDAVQAVAPGGEAETGLVLVPFQGWGDEGFDAGVKVLTFSATTLTARGTLEHQEPVRRAFLTAPDTAASLSDVALVMHDVADPDAPATRGRVELAPSFGDIVPFGAYGARVATPTDYAWYTGQDEVPMWRVEMVPLAGDPDAAEPVASFEIPPGALVQAMGTRLVTVASRWEPRTDKDVWATHVAVWNLADPTSPQPEGTLTLDDLGPFWDGWAAPADIGGWDRAWGWYGTPNAKVVGQALVFVEWRQESGPGGTLETCVTAPPPAQGQTEPGDPVGPGEDPDDERPDADPYYTGEIRCTSVDGGEPVCDGAIWYCDWFEVGCVVVDPSTVQTETKCETTPWTKYWRRYVMHVVDLSDPLAPELQPALEMPVEDEGATTVVQGSTLWYAFRRPYEVEGDTRPYVRWYVRAIDLTAPSAPAVGAAVNVPGVLMAATSDEIYTHDFLYNGAVVESAVSRLTVADDVATLVARHRFGERTVDAMAVEGASYVLVAHRAASPYPAPDGGGWVDPVSGGGSGGGSSGGGTGTADAGAATPGGATPKADDPAADADLATLSVLAVGTLQEVGSVSLDTWAHLRAAFPGKALLQVPGGLILVRLDPPTAPAAQAFFATLAWPQEVYAVGGKLLFAAGRYGIYSLDLDADKLLPAP